VKKIIVILGPTASGKSALAVKIARKFNGEVVSADSRQIYRGMDIGTGKISKKEMQGVPHYLLDVAGPKQRFTASQYKQSALNAIDKIFRKGKLPILCGGTGFYIRAVIDGILMPEVPPDWKLRKKLDKRTPKELLQMLKRLDSRRAKTIEKENPRRLIRALEIVLKTKKPVPEFQKNPLPYPVLFLGAEITKKELAKRVEKRIEKMFKLGLEKEAKRFPLPIIGYQEWKDYFKEKITKKEVKTLIKIHTLQFAKRQMTWWKKDERIKWVKNYREAEKSARNFLDEFSQ